MKRLQAPNGDFSARPPFATSALPKRNCHTSLSKFRIDFFDENRLLAATGTTATGSAGLNKATIGTIAGGTMDCSDRQRENFCISTDKDRLDIDAVHAFLSRSYWSEGIPKEVVVRAI